MTMRAAIISFIITPSWLESSFHMEYEYHWGGTPLRLWRILCSHGTLPWRVQGFSHIPISFPFLMVHQVSMGIGRREEASVSKYSVVFWCLSSRFKEDFLADWQVVHCAEKAVPWKATNKSLDLPDPRLLGLVVLYQHVSPGDQGPFESYCLLLSHLWTAPA
jgi:hypothetical protein